MNVESFLLYVKKNALSFYFVLLAFLGYAAKYALNIVLAHHLSSRLLGDFNIALRTLGLLTAFALMGTHTASKRFVSHYLHHHRNDMLEDYIAWNFRFIRISFTVCVVVAITAYLVMHALHIWHIKDIRDYHLAIYMLWVAPLAALWTLLSSYLLCANYPILSQIFQNTKNILYIVLFFFLVLWLKIAVDRDSLFLLIGTSILLLCIVELGVIIKKTPFLFTIIRRACLLKKPRRVHPDWMRVSFRLICSGLIFVVICAIDLILVKLIVPAENAAGLYAVALTIASFVFVIPQNLFTLIKTKMSRLMMTKSGQKRLGRELRTLNRFSLATILLFGGVIFLFSKALLLHFGGIYLEAESVLLILVFGFMVGAYAHAATAVLAYGGYETLLLRVSIIELTVFMILGIVLTYCFGIIGTALATTLTMVLKTVLFNSVVYRAAQIKAYQL
ncbi:MAG: hypothetical protein Q8L68_00935 [Methylococcales bacterium]|nr:hypothetical protein [Methylococcales bacterium]